MSGLFVKKGDRVRIMSGEDKGATGKVLQAFPAENKVIVEGVNIAYNFRKARSAKETGGIIKQELAIDASKVSVLCPTCEQPTRVGYKIENGEKSRICKNKKCGAKIEVLKDDKADKKAKKAKKADKDAKKPETEKTVKEKAEKAEKTEKAVKEDAKVQKPKTAKAKDKIEQA